MARLCIHYITIPLRVKSNNYDFSADFFLFYTLLNFKNLKTFLLFKMGLCKFKNCSIQNLLHFLGGGILRGGSVERDIRW